MKYLKNSIFAFFVALSSVAFLASAFGSVSTKPLSESTWIVEFKQVPSSQTLSTLKDEIDIRHINRFLNLPTNYFRRTYKVVLNAAALENLKASALVNRIEPVFSIEPASIDPAKNSSPPVSDLLFNYQWGVWNQGQTVYRDIDDIHLHRVGGQSEFDIGWVKVKDELSKRSLRQVVVAILDFGVDYDHPELAPHIFTNEAECEDGNIPFRPETDNDGNGFKGDCKGWSFTDKRNPNRPADRHGHGTHLAGIISASANNGTGVMGVASNVKILPVQVTSEKEGIGNNKMAPVTDRIAEGLAYATKMGANVANLSLGWPMAEDTQYLREVFAYAQEQGMIIVAAAGNDGHDVPILPCAYPGVICVGSSGIDGKASPSTNHGGHVDLLAPGDNILSTYPQTLDPVVFPIKGYEIKSGSSQSAAFVSGIVGVLKGLYPNDDSDAIKARLFAATALADSGNKHFQNGAVRLDLAIRYQAQPVVRPDFKGIGVVSCKRPSLRCEFEISVKNYGSVSSQGVNIEIESSDSDLHVMQKQFSLGTLKKNTIRRIPVSVKARNEMVDSTFEYRVRINETGRESVAYHHRVTLAGELNDSPAMAFEFEDLTEGGEDLRTVDDFFFREPSYYLEQKTDEGTELRIFQNVDGKFLAKKVLKFVNAQKLTNIITMDFNVDGQRDYMVGTYVVEGEDENQHSYILYSFYNSDLEPLFGENSHWKFEPEGFLIDYKTLRFVNYELPQVGLVRIPVFMVASFVPKADQNPNDLEFETNSPQRRVNYLLPVWSDGLIKMQSHTLQNYQFEKRLSNELGLRYGDSIDVIELLPQSLNQLEQGQIQAILSIGRGVSRNYYLAKMTSKELISRQPQLTSLNLRGAHIEAHAMIPLMNIEGAQSRLNEGASFVGFFSSILARVLTLDPLNMSRQFADVRVDQEDKEDHLFGARLGFFKNNMAYTVFQSRDHLTLIKSSSQLFERQSVPIVRSTFIPGQIVEETYFPMALGDGQLNPAVFADSSRINSGHIYARVASEGQFGAPLKYSLLISDECRSLAPVRMNGKWSYTVLCQAERGYTLYIKTH